MLAAIYLIKRLLSNYPINCSVKSLFISHFQHCNLWEVFEICISQFVKWMEIKWQRKDMMQTNFHGDLVSFFLCPFIDKLIVFRFCSHCWNAHDTEFLYCYDYDLTDEIFICLNNSATLNLINFTFLKIRLIYSHIFLHLF